LRIVPSNADNREQKSALLAQVEEGMADSAEVAMSVYAQYVIENSRSLFESGALTDADLQVCIPTLTVNNADYSEVVSQVMLLRDQLISFARGLHESIPRPNQHPSRESLGRSSYPPPGYVPPREPRIPLEEARPFTKEELMNPPGIRPLRERE